MGSGTRFSRRLLFARWMIAFVLCVTAASASAQQDAAASAKVIAWANANIGNYNRDVDYARNGAKPQVPVPPMVDPPCQLCGDTTQTQGEAQVAAWVQRSLEPEATYIKELLSMDREIQHLGGSDLLTPAAQRAVHQFEDDAGFMSDVGKLSDRVLYGKAIPMAQKYDKEPKQAYAGILFLINVEKSAALIQGYREGSASHREEDHVLELAKTWELAITNKIDSDVVAGHQYNLCPVYAEIFRSVVLLGGEEPRDMDQYQQKLQKLQDLVKFDVDVTLQVAIDDSDGSHMHATWAGKARLTLNLDLAKNCYTPVFNNGGQMAVNVTNWDMIAVETASNGTKTQVPVQLISSHSYQAKLGTPQLNLCDPQPDFQMPLSNISVPQEEIMANGHTSNAAFLGSFLSAVVSANELNTSPTNAVTGATPSLPGGTASSRSSSSASQGTGSPGMARDQQLLEAHKGDVNWLMSPEGQAVIADMQKQVLQTAQSRMAAAGLVIPNASTFGVLVQSIASTHLAWSNGSAQPVNKTLHLKKDTSEITLTVSVQQAR